MKKTILLAIGILLPFFIFSQIGFQKFYGRPNNDQEFRGVLQMDDGGFLLGGTDYSTNGMGADFWLVKTDSLGNEEWSKHFGEYKSETLYFINKMPDGGFLLTGEQGIDKDITQIYLIRLKSNFELEWVIKIPHNNKNNHPKSVYVGSDGSSIIAVSSTGSTATFFRLNPDGTTDWKLSPNPMDNPVGITNTIDGHYFLYGTGGETGSKRTYVTKAAIGGNIVWVKEINLNGAEKLEVGAVTKPQYSIGHVLYGYKGSITKIDDEANIIWQQNAPAISWPVKIEELTYNDFYIYSRSSIYNVKVWPNGSTSNQVYSPAVGTSEAILGASFSNNSGHLLTGQFRNIDGGNDAFLIHVDSINNTDWTQYFGDLEPNHHDNGYAVFQTPDNGYFLAGSSHFKNTGQDFYIVKTDSTGIVEWNLNYSFPNGAYGDYGFTNIAPSADGNFIFIGFNRGGSDSINIIFLKTDLLGNIAAVNSFQKDNSFQLKSCIPLPDSNFLLTAIYPYNFFDYFSEYVKINNEGDTLWSKKISHLEQRKRIGKSILTSDNYVINIGKNSKNDFGWIFKTDSEGEIVFDLEIDVNQEDTYIFYDIAETSQNNFLIPYFNEDRNKLSILEITSDGAIAEDKVLTNQFNDISHPHIDQINNNEYLISFSVNSNFIYVMHINEELEVLDVHKYARLGNISDTQPTSDNSLAIFGDGFNNNNSDLFLMKTWPNGAVQTLNIQPLGKMDVYPNPSSNELNIHFESEYIGNIEITIINPNGQQLFHFSETKNNPVIKERYELADLPSGAYFIRLMAGERSISRVWMKR